MFNNDYQITAKMIFSNGSEVEISDVTGKGLTLIAIENYPFAAPHKTILNMNLSDVKHLIKLLTLAEEYISENT